MRVALCLLVASLAQALTCSVSATGLAFGSYNPFSGTPLTSSASVSVQCSTLVALFLSYDVQIDSGASGSFFPRKMNGSAGTLDYNVFLDGGYSSVWGTGGGGTSKASFGALIAIGTFTNHYTAFGRMPAQSTAKPGSYGDSLTVTIYY